MKIDYMSERVGNTNVIALQRDQDKYLIMYDDSQRLQAMGALGRYASNPKLNFTWNDAVILFRKMKEA